MDYRELLERLSQKMPEGWRLTLGGRVMPDVLRYESPTVKDTYTLGRRTDVGLAPLTALLKQEMGRKRELALYWDGKDRWDCSTCATGSGIWDADSPEKTEFEAVALAYLATREKE